MAKATPWVESLVLKALAAAFLLLTSLAQATPTKLGDLDDDGVFTANDLAKLVGHSSGTTPLSPTLQPFADLTQDGFINDADHDALVSLILESSTPQNLPLASIREVSPATGEGDVAVTRETVLHFSMPLALNAALDTSKLYAEFGGRKILSRVEISSDKKKATLFYLEPLPSNARIRVSFDSTGVNDLLGRAIDGDGDGQTGGSYITSFDTLSITPVAGTAISGRVFASERGTGGNEVPLAGVTITVDGAEQTLRTTTDAQGNFTLNPSPAGSFFVHIDGRTSPQSAWPNGDYYPSVGKRWEALAGRTDNLSGNSEDTSRGTIYLPRVLGTALKTVSQTQDTQVEFPASILADNPALAGTELDVPANSLFADDGTRGGRVGIAPVAPDRLPSPLPPGLNLPMVITIQTDGATNFDRPVPICFPNLPDPVTGEKLPPGAKSALWSFNHDLGDWEVVGPMTVTEDGNFVKTDAGVGVRQPGWHGPPPGRRAGTQLSAGRNLPDRSPCDIASEAQAYLTKKVAKYGSVLAEKAFWLQLDIGLGLLGKSGALLRNSVSKIKQIDNSLDALQRDLSEGNEGNSQWRENASELIDLAELTNEIRENETAERALGAAGFLLDMNEVTELHKETEQLKVVYQSALRQCLDDVFWQPPGNKEPPNTSIPAPPPPYPSGFVPSATPAPRSAITTIMTVSPNMGASSHPLQRFASNFSPTNPTGGLSTAEFRKLLADVRPLTEALTSLNAYGQVAPHMSSVANQTFEMAELARAALDTIAQGQIRPSKPETPERAYCLLEFNGFQQRFTINNGFNLDRALPSETACVLSFYLPNSKRTGIVTFFTARIGQTTRLPPVFYVPDRGADGDMDGLSDDAEEIIGTDPELDDSDSDGVLDGVEVQQGSNPLDNTALATGVVASVPTTSAALDVAAFNNIAVTANGSSGVSIFNVLSGVNPTRIGDVNTPGIAQAVACNESHAMVADGLAGIHVIDLKRIPPAGIRIDVGAMVTCVTVNGPIGFAGTNDGQVIAVDLAASRILRRHTLASRLALQDLVMAGDVLYALQAGRLSSLTYSALVFTPGGSVTLPGALQSRRLRLAAGLRELYATHSSGFNIIDIATNPLAPTLVRQVVTQQLDWKQMITAGSGRGLAVVSPNPGDSIHDVDLYSLGTDGRGSTFTTTLETPGMALAASVYNGLAYMADGDSGLQVINYLPPDRLRQPPQITLSASIPLSPSPFIEEGKLMRLTADVSDDVQVRNVEFHVDGELAAVDGSFPFEYRFITPLRQGAKTSFTLRARATDLGGNSTWSPLVTVSLTADTTAPVVLAMFPSQGGMVGASRQALVIFNEAMLPSSLPEAIQVLAPGADLTLGTVDDVPLPATFGWREEDRAATLSFAQSLSPSSYRFRVLGTVKDLVGNPLGANAVADFLVYSTQSDTDGDGIPDELEVALGLNPLNPDSNGNGTGDGLEDMDGDGINNMLEVRLGLNLNLNDSDGDGILDLQDDEDGDGLLPLNELQRGTNPLLADSDGDGMDDGSEVASGTDPLAPTPFTRVYYSDVVSYGNEAGLTVEAQAMTLLSAPVSYANEAGQTIETQAMTLLSAPVSYANEQNAVQTTTTATLLSQPVSYRNETP